MIKYNNLIDAICKKEQPSKDMYINFIERDSEYSIKWSNFLSTSKKMLYALEHKGVSKNAIAIIQIENGKDYLHAFWACVIGGIIPIILSPSLTEEEYQKLHKIWCTVDFSYIIADESIANSFFKFVQEKETSSSLTLQDKMILVQELMNAELESTGVKAEENDIVLIQYSSGATGNPKGIIVTHQNLMYDLYGVIDREQVSMYDSFLSWLPLTHNLGLMVLHILPVILNANQYIMSKKLFAYNPGIYLSAIERHKITVSASPNFGFKFISDYIDKAEQVWNLSNLRIMWNGAEPIDATVCREFIKKMKRHGFINGKIVAGYGLSEATVVVTVMESDSQFECVYVDRNAIELGSVVEEQVATETFAEYVLLGKAIEGCFIRICDENNYDLGELKIGYIQIKGKNIMPGYYKDSNSTNKVFTKDGWLKTGDVGFLRNENLIITGRHKEMFIINGKNYFPNDIEHIIESAKPELKGKIAICGVELFNQIETMAIFIEMDTSVADYEYLHKDINKKLSQKGVPMAQILFKIDKVLKTHSGKIRRNDMKKQANKLLFQRKHKIETILLECCRKVTKEDIKLETEFISEKFLSSLELFSFSALIEDSMGIEISPIKIAQFDTLQQMSDYISVIKRDIIEYKAPR